MKRFSLILLLPMAVSLSSCIDKSYDLEDVDYTIGTYANLTLPSSSTGDIILRNVMNLEEERFRELQRKDMEHDVRLDQQAEKDEELVAINRLKTTAASAATLVRPIPAA